MATAFPIAVMKALLRRPPAPGEVRIPRLERALPAAVADERKLDKLRRLCRFPDDGYLPLTWPHIAGWRAHMENMADPRFPLPLPGIVHVRSRLVQHRQIGAGEALRPVCFVEGVRETFRGLEFDLETHAYSGAELVWQGTATMLSRRHTDMDAKRPRTQAPDGVGSVNRVWLIPTRTALDYAVLSGDLNPIHLSKVTARLFGFKGTVVHGMWSLGRVAAMHPDLLSRPGLTVACDFKLPIVLPTQVVYRHWADGTGVTQFRLLDKSAARPHASGTLSVLSTAPESLG